LQKGRRNREDLVGCDSYDGCEAQIATVATDQVVGCHADLCIPGLGRLQRLRWLRYLTSQPPKYANGQLRSFVPQATISLSLDNQSSSAGVAPNKNEKNMHIFHEYFELIYHFSCTF
jgi:hypothetical protein